MQFRNNSASAIAPKKTNGDNGDRERANENGWLQLSDVMQYDFGLVDIMLLNN